MLLIFSLYNTLCILYFPIGTVNWLYYVCVPTLVWDLLSQTIRSDTQSFYLSREYRGRGWPSKVKSQNQKLIFKVKIRNQISNVDLRNEKSIRKLKRQNQMSISEATLTTPLPPSPINSEDLVASSIRFRNQA